MPKEKEMDVRKIVSMPADLAEAIKVYRADERIGTEAEAIRQLLMEALEARGRSIKTRRAPK
jgi:hypothetical protein